MLVNEEDKDTNTLILRIPLILLLEAFNVFKVFVANPEKSAAVLHILQRNRERLIQYFESFQPEKREQTRLTHWALTALCTVEDEQFKEEKMLVIEEIKKLE